MNILLLEDDIALNRAIRKVLELDRHIVTSFTDGQTMLESLSQEYDLYILDIRVPHISGMELLDIIMLQNRDARVMMISVNTDIQSLETAYSLGCVDYLKKPFHIAELRAKVNRINKTKGYSASSIKLKDKETVLTKKEKQLLDLLLENLTHVVSYETIERSIYENKTMSMNAIRALVLRLRAKLADDIIKNVIDEGYTIMHLPATSIQRVEGNTRERILALTQENFLLKQEKESLLKKSTTDPLTGLYNRVKIEEIFFYEQKQYIEQGDMLSIILMDLDDFKTVNDTYGHITGDKYLVTLAKKLKNFSRNGDFVGRWGGEEFIILLSQTTLDQAKKTALRLQSVINNISCPKLKKRTASYGVSTLRDNDTLNTLIERADRALLLAKSKGKNRVETAA